MRSTRISSHSSKRERIRDGSTKTRSEEALALTLNEQFRKASVGASNFLGSPWVFIANVLLILVWLAFGPVLHLLMRALCSSDSSRSAA